MTDFVFYHGNASPKKMLKLKRIAPDIVHRLEFEPDTLKDKKQRYFLDNGAFTDSFNPEKWIDALKECQKLELQPDFVVLPDKFDNPAETWRRHDKYFSEAKKREFDYYAVGQKPANPGQIVEEALNIGASGVFIGGSWGWKRRNSEEIVKLCHRNGLKCHIGMPRDFYWAYCTGADSIDSTSVVRNRSWSRVKSLNNMIEEQTGLERYT